MNDYVIFRKNAWPDEAALERAAGRSARVANEVRPIARTVIVEADPRKV